MSSAPYPLHGMFFGSKRRRLTRSSGRGSGRGRAADGTGTVRGHAPQLRSWRESAQRVTRAWNAWLAADVPERGWRYRAYEEALAEEEQAAAQVERMLQLAAAEQKGVSDDCGG